MTCSSKHLCRETQECFRSAENAIRQVISQKYFSLNEEMITHLFWCELRHEAKLRNEKDLWAKALSRDILEALHGRHPPFSDGKLEGLTCDVQLHSKMKEAKTGGDFGLFVSLPLLNNIHGFGQEIRIDFVDRALLVQAKRIDSSGYKGSLKKHQKELLARHHQFSALLIY